MCVFLYGKTFRPQRYAQNLTRPKKGKKKGIRAGVLRGCDICGWQSEEFKLPLLVFFDNGLERANEPGFRSFVGSPSSLKILGFFPLVLHP